MSDKIKAEQEKLANHLKKLSAEERERQGFAVMCWLQGYETGYQSAKSTKEENKK